MTKTDLYQISARAAEARSRICAAVLQTPVLASRSHSGLWFKAENFQRTGSFKLRGAMSKLTALPVDARLITASSGNHGIACSEAASRTGHDLTVVLPETVAKAKLTKIENYGVNVILVPGDSGKAEAHARALSESGDSIYVSPYNDPDVMAGQGTIALELLEQLPEIDNIFVSMGGGGLISGIGAVLKARSPGTRIIGVSATNSGALAASMVAGQIVETEHLDTLADGCAGGVDEGSITLPVAAKVIDRVIHCAEDQIADALQQIAWGEKMLVEGAAAMAMAAYLSESPALAGQNSVVLLCGANFDDEVIRPILAAV
jgi:threonine dehydratase